MPRRPSVAIVSPATAQANNGNWRTAERWAAMLASECDVRVLQAWPDGGHDSGDPQGAARRGAPDDILIALHARRSADSVRAWHAQRGARGLCVVLTGTDLYGDLPNDPLSLASIAAASRLVVLQEDALGALPEPAREKARVIYQSTEALPPAPKPADHLVAVMAGHLREVKSPQTYFDAARLLGDLTGLQLLHIGAAEDASWAERAREVERACPAYRWLGALPHAATREAIRDAHVLVHPSLAEGGAHVIMEAVCSGTPVLASRVSGNVGMLGADYDGYFAPGDAKALAARLELCREQQSQTPANAWLEHLGAQCARRAPYFAPGTERAALLRLVRELENA